MNSFQEKQNKAGSETSYGMKSRIGAVLIVLAAVGLGFFVFTPKEGQTNFGFRLGLDLAGGTLLTYRADVSGVASSDVGDAMNSLREVIERRVNLFGVSEPLVQVEQARLAGGREERLIVELPGVTDVDEAVRQLGETPILEFKLVENREALTSGATTTTPTFVSTGLTGRFLTKSQLQFSTANGAGVIQQPVVSLSFNEEGTTLFAQITRDNIGEVLAIFLDGVPISAPIIQVEITDGKAIITGIEDRDEARLIVRDLNFGALPVPIELVGAESIGPTLGSEMTRAGMLAGFWGLIVIALFMILWYRLPGIIAAITLAIYAVLLLTIFKLIGITLTAPGIAGIILSIGMAVDANILVFERMKEEIRAGKQMGDAISEGFSRAWFSIRDGNLTSIFTGVILFYTTTSLVKGFALTLILGVVVSLFTAVAITRTLLSAIAPKNITPAVRFLFGSGLSKS